MEKIKVTIAWIDREFAETKESYEFDTADEANAFLRGVEEAMGYDGYEIVGPLDPMLMTSEKETESLLWEFIQEKQLGVEFNDWVAKAPHRH